ncbi:hypothetical protein SA19056_20440 [Staphylococcus argenteus]|nr:hypothetical protein SA19056_20440 [Staphylococcus argenteus]GJF42505.1 hypothetical protein SA19059_21570 [Staphylococcus argenteus]
MDLLIGTLFLFLVLVIFTLFTYKAPNGMRAMGALANAAIATFLVEAFNKYVGGEVFGIKFLGELGDAAGSLGGVAAAGLTALAIGVSPVYALVIAAACGGMDLLPGFFAGYIIGYVMKYTEKICAGWCRLNWIYCYPSTTSPSYCCIVNTSSE